MTNYFLLQAVVLTLLLTPESVSTSFSSKLLVENCSHLHRKIGLVLPKSNKNNNHCKIEQVFLLSRAWNSNLRAGDEITAINQQQLNPANPCRELKNQLQQLEDKQQTITLKIISKAVARTVVIPSESSGFMNNQALSLPISTFSTDSMTDKLSKLQFLLQEEWLDIRSTTDLYQNLSCLSEESPAPVLPLINTIQNNPLELASGIEWLKHHLLPSKAEKYDFSLADLLIKIQSLSYKVSHKKAGIAVIPLHCSSKKLFDQLEQFIIDSHQLSKKAFTNVNRQDTIFFMKHFQLLSNSIRQSQSIMNEPNETVLENINQLFEIAARVNYAQLSQAAEHWFQLANPNWLGSLKTCVNQLSNSRVLERKTPFGKIILGTHNNDIYTIHPGEDNIALLIDPAGNDLYTSSQDTRSSEKMHLYNSAIIDLAGNDQYHSTALTGFAFAALGITLLVDAMGNDQYKAKKWAQGSAFAGIAALYDDNGNDQYSADSFSQALALFGSGLLVDRKGDDIYSIKHHGQALGLPYGHGVLMDNNGNDRYTMHNGLRSSYTEGKKTSESWGQGCGKGFRHILPGGLGILFDTQGNDTFSAHEFAQGGGYFYGMGLFYNLGKGDDHYRGSRYNVGFSAHQAIGGFVEASGNDHYQTTGPAFCGTAWDQSISIFYDQSGNDTYRNKDFSLAASAHNSIASFWDISGQNRFSPPTKPAFITSNKYHGGQSLSYFFSIPETFPQRINRDKQEFVIVSPVTQWQLSAHSLLKSISEKKNIQTTNKAGNLKE